MSPCHCSTIAPVDASPHYFVVMQSFGTAGLEAAPVQPEIDRAEVIRLLKTRNYRDVVFIHEIVGGKVHDVTLALIGEARNLVFA